MMVNVKITAHPQDGLNPPDGLAFLGRLEVLLESFLKAWFVDPRELCL